MPDDDATGPAGPATTAGPATAGQASSAGSASSAGPAGPVTSGGGPVRGITLTRGWALFLVAVGVWNWVIWPRFALAIWDDPRAWSTRVVGHGSPTGFLWIHAVLIVVSVAVGTAVGVLGIRALLRLYRRARAR